MQIRLQQSCDSCKTSGSWGFTLGGQGRSGFAGSDVSADDIELVDNDEGAIAFGDPADLLSRIPSYDNFGDSESTEEDDDDEADGWREEA